VGWGNYPPPENENSNNNCETFTGSRENFRLYCKEAHSIHRSSTNSSEIIRRMFEHSQNRIFAEYSNSKDLSIRRTLHECSANIDLKCSPNVPWMLVVRILSRVPRSDHDLTIAFSLLSSFYAVLPFIPSVSEDVRENATRNCVWR